MEFVVPRGVVIIFPKLIGKGNQGKVWESNITLKNGKVVEVAAKEFKSNTQRRRDIIRNEVNMMKLAGKRAPRIYAEIQFEGKTYLIMEKVQQWKGEYYEGDLRKIKRMIMALAKKGLVNGDGDFGYRVTAKGTEWLMLDWGASLQYSSCLETKQELGAWAQGAIDMYPQELAEVIIDVCSKFKCPSFNRQPEDFRLIYRC